MLDLLIVVLRFFSTATSNTELLKRFLVVFFTCILLAYSPEITIQFVISDTLLNV